MFDYTVETSKSVEEAVKSLEENLKEKQFGVLWQFDVKETLESKGLDYEKPFMILEVCNPKEAQKVLTANQKVGYMLPCKMVVYEDDQDGKTKIGMPKPTELINMVGDDSINDIAKDIENRLIEAIEQSK
ncbi:DUF302 domain-containing protein [Allobacillus halotolerans]|uniref:DUF302 domain-containing protein n=1 Tax=Allobacillus halotolerans TaxID=570278 RepID=A0ABS6GQU2_9BACI|nr:DUF302 domain-containing protein [Allobacillus halotolerans]MBU6081265.1 DUF302 domain-containing protein [Allobacillus halotolerans]